MPDDERQVRRLLSGKIGELLVELELTARGWHVERLDGAAKAANGDLIAILGRHRVVIQVKTNGTQKDRVFLGYAGKFLQHGATLFNAKQAAIETDIVVSVTGGHQNAEFYIFTVTEADQIAQSHASNWYETPTRKGAKRSVNFPISPKCETLQDHRDRWEKLVKVNVLAYAAS